MLPLVSSMTTQENGSGSFWKSVSVTGWALSKTSKSAFVRSGTRRLSASVTVT